jgi:hypothetical protein
MKGFVMRTVFVLIAIVCMFAIPSVSLASGAEVVPQRFCGVQIEEGGTVFFGEGITVQTPSGGRTIVCKVSLPAGTSETQVLLNASPKGNILVLTRSGQLIFVLTICGPSEPEDACP